MRKITAGLFISLAACRRREEECLPQRLETPVGSVDPDDDASEYGHASTLRQRPLRLPVILRRKPLLVDALL
jgi:hypothetical protein